MPPKRACPVAFLKQILTGEKTYFFNADVPNVYID